MRLGVRFTLLIIFILSTTLALTSVLHFRAERELIEEQLIERGNVLGHFVSLIAPDAMLAHDYIGLDGFAKEITSQRDVIYSVFLDEIGQPLTSYYDKELVDGLLLESVDPRESYRRIRLHFGSDDDVTLQEFPVMHEGKVVGTVIIGISRRALAEQFEYLVRQRVLGYGFVILFLVIAIYLVFRRSVLQPVDRLMLGSKSIAHGNLDIDIKVGSNDELGHLTEMFNYMATEIRQEREELSRQASIDALTGLPNRMLAKDRLEVELRRARRDGVRVAVMFIDLNNFKIINDTMGHVTGDELLVEVSRRMAARLRDGDTLARLGGDEFVVILPNIKHISEVEEVAERMLENVEQPIHLRERELRVSYSMGAALYPDDGFNAQSLMANADNAMYQAKSAGSKHVRFFSQEMNEEIQSQLQLEQDLHKARERGELKLNFQPLIDIRTGEYLGAEVLLRWRHPEHGYISPETFIPLAEMTGQIVLLGEWVIREAVRCVADWRRRGLQPKRISVNISRVQFQGGVVKLIDDVLREYDFPPQQLMLEITETVLMENVETIRSQLDQLTDAGIDLALDDFGTGYSSLSYLKNFPVRTLKLDKSFVDGVCDNEEDNELVRGIIALARGLKLRVIAEGVETRGQLDRLHDLGCDAAQGYFISHPMGRDAFEEYLRNQLDFPATRDGVA